MDETKRTAIIDKNGNNILANVVESIDNPGTYGLVALNPDGSSIAAGGSNLPYTAINSSVTITEGNVYGVDATSGDINLTLSNGTVAGKVLTVKKLDNTDNIVYINNNNIDGETSVELTIQNESIDMYRTGAAFIIK